MRQCNTVDVARRSPSYEVRLAKYAARDFEVRVPALRRADVDPTVRARAPLPRLTCPFSPCLCSRAPVLDLRARDHAHPGPRAPPRPREAREPRVARAVRHRARRPPRAPRREHVPPLAPRAPVQGRSQGERRGKRRAGDERLRHGVAARAVWAWVGRAADREARVQDCESPARARCVVEGLRVLILDYSFYFIFIFIFAGIGPRDQLYVLLSMRVRND